jgi:signal transduction histidine kinase
LIDLATDQASAVLDAFDISVEELLNRARDETVAPEEFALATLHFGDAADQQHDQLIVICRQLIQITEAMRSGDFGNTELQEQLLDLQEQADSNLELLQLGQAVQIISHEFDASIRAVRAGLRGLDPWARANPALASTVRDVKASFQHLDTYLRLFTPLQRRLYRSRVTINGGEIADFVLRLFGERLTRDRISLTVSHEFRSWDLFGFPSTFYPVFVNLVDNAIYWVSKSRPDDGVITFQADEDGLIVSDNGLGIPARDRGVIFERGFSRRPGGRGLGLAVSKELLARDGWTLELKPAHSEGHGAEFRIAPTEQPE